MLAESATVVAFVGKQTTRKQALIFGQFVGRVDFIVQLFYGHTLCEISRLVYVASSTNSDVVRKQLERYHLEQRKQEFPSVRYGQQVVRHFGDFLVTFARNSDDNPTTCLDLLNIRECLFVMDTAFLRFRISRG
jgi:hypothetical protein